mgnify:CR=1 FL=1
MPNNKSKIGNSSAMFARRQFLKSSLLAGSGCLASLQGFAQDARSATTSDIVKTTKGQVQGLRLSGGVQAFYGVPYGASTAAANRFKKAGPVAAWSGVRDAAAMGNRCPQGPRGSHG